MAGTAEAPPRWHGARSSAVDSPRLMPGLGPHEQTAWWAEAGSICDTAGLTPRGSGQEALLFTHGRKWASPKGPCARGGAGLAGHPAGLGRTDLQGRAEEQRGRWQGTSLLAFWSRVTSEDPCPSHRLDAETTRLAPPTSPTVRSPPAMVPRLAAYSTLTVHAARASCGQPRVCLPS